jgi:hypothetical protein
MLDPGFRRGDKRNRSSEGRHSGEIRNPEAFKCWTPAFAGVTNVILMPTLHSSCLALRPVSTEPRIRLAESFDNRFFFIFRSCA